ncbi:MAG: 60S ribosomal export protein NMD3 [Halobacteriaceae archaeon]
MSEADSREFCPNCGDPVPPGTAERGSGSRRDRALCDACYFERYDLVDAPDRVDVRVCGSCGAVERGDGWVDVGARDYTDVAVEAVAERLGVHADATDVSWEVDPEQVDATTVRMHCHFSGVVRETPLQESVTVPVRIATGTCTRCGRIAGDYYASRVQVRATDREPAAAEERRAREIAEEVVADHVEDGDREAFVTEVSELPEGLDLKVSTVGIGERIARRLVTEFGGTVSDSETLVTEDEDGDEVYRVTFAVRLPPFRPGDVVDLDDGDGPVLVRSVRGNLKGVRLTTGDPYEADYRDGDAPDARRLATREDAVETTVVAVEDEHAVQVLDPETYEAKTVARPDYLDPDAETVPVVKTRAGLHVLPAADAER